MMNKLLSVTALTLIAGSAAHAQVGGNTLVGATGPWLPTAITPDLRPVAYIYTWNGDTSNDLRLASWWYDNDLADPPVSPVDIENADGSSGVNGIPDVFDELIRRFDDCYDRGFRRITMNLPAGNPLDGYFMASSQWHTMPQWRQNGFDTTVKAWIDSKQAAGDPVEIGVYAGFLVRDPDTFWLGDDYPSANYPGDLDTTSVSSMSKFLQNVRPWIDAGITEYWLDTASGVRNWPTAITMQSSPDYAGIIRFGGEAVPTTNTGVCQSWKTSNSSLDYMPWSSIFRFAEIRMRNKVFDNSVHEVHMRLSGHQVKTTDFACPAESFDYVWNMQDAIHFHENGSVIDGGQGYNNKARTREYMTWPARPFADYTTPGQVGIAYNLEAIQKLYDFGPIASLADFNGNGLMEVTTAADPDFDLFLQQWNLYKFTAGPHSFTDGDINGDDLVDFNDITDFSAAAQEWNTNGNIVPIDLGDPDWLP